MDCCAFCGQDMPPFDHKKEKLVPVPGHDGYWASRSGGIYSTRGGRENNPRKIGRMGNHGYLRVNLRREDGGSTEDLVHRIIARIFLGPQPPDHEVRHLDGNKLNNHAANLAWGTSAENAADARAHGTMMMGERHYGSKLTENDVAEIRRLRDSGMKQKAVADRFGVTIACISAIDLGRTWKNT